MLDTAGNATTHEIPKDENGEDKAVTITDGAGNSYTVDKDGNVTKGGENAGGDTDGTETDSVVFVQKELIKEVLEYYKEEINLWLENNGKAMPDCLPEDEGKLEAVLAGIEEYLEDPETLLNLVKGDDVNKTRIEELTTKITGIQPPYADGLSEMEWDELLEMVCPYLLQEEEDPVQYVLPLTIYVDDDYFLSNPDITEFSDGDTVSVYYYMAGVTLFVKDSAGQEMTLTEDNFPDTEGIVWSPGFTIDIEDLEQDSVVGFEIRIPAVDTLQISVVKVPLPSDVPTFDIDEDDIEDVADNCTDWSEDNDVSFTCNFCVRDAFYKITGSTILYAGSPNNSCVCCDPQETNLTGGLVEGNGTANTIYNTLTDDDSDLAQYFEEIDDMEGEDYPDFTQMQLDANNGQLIMGVLERTGPGHIVLLMPEDLWNGTGTRDEVALTSGTMLQEPTALECGSATDKRVKPLSGFGSMTSNDFKNIKWYKYTGL